MENRLVSSKESHDIYKSCRAAALESQFVLGAHGVSRFQKGGK